MAKAKVERRESDEITFGCLADGDWFLDADGDLLVKVTPKQAAYILIDGSAGLMNFDDDDEVTPVNVTITY